MAMRSLGDILKKQMKQSSVGQRITATLVVEKANQVVKDMFGPGVIKYVQAVYFKEKVIALTCLSSVMAQEIKLNEKRIIAEINEKLEALVVEKIRYLI
jgi:predicted nucleic acid-binding Zn ribbon protein